jgi:UPF0716 protein FxsA
MTRIIPLLILAGMVAEIASIIWVGKALGVIPALLLLFAGGIIGVKLLKLAGTSVMKAFRSPVQSASAIGGVGSIAVARIFAGLLFLIPGFFSDILALLILLPPVQSWIRARFRVETFSTGGARPAEPFAGNQYGTVIEGEAVEIVAEVEPPPSSNKGAR